MSRCCLKNSLNEVGWQKILYVNSSYSLKFVNNNQTICLVIVYKI